MAATLSRMSPIPSTIASTACAPSLDTRTASCACVATSSAFCAACSAVARISSVAVVVWLMAADCWLAPAVCWFTVARISEADELTACAFSSTFEDI